MLSTQTQHWTCPGCRKKYEGREGVKISRNGDSARIVWKRVKIGSETRQIDTMGSFECVECHTQVPV